ncbi:MAG: hypothetical protein JWQ10_3689 [Herbaspirillum sp.]|jgi:hypothetical protein|nr:hypothetical protein [Herbaspirillum sp.]
MDQELVAAEIQALLASLKASLSKESDSADSVQSSPVNTDLQSTQCLSQDALPNPRSLRRFLLMV